MDFREKNIKERERTVSLFDDIFSLNQFCRRINIEKQQQEKETDCLKALFLSLS
jgi:hypothetical protein